MLKRFIEWIQNKINLDTKERIIEINQGEVYWCALGENIGDEENGKGDNFRRPVLVLKKFNKNIFWGVPLSTKNKDNIYDSRVLLKNIEQSAMISQLRVLDTKRLDKKIGYISRKDFVDIQNAIINTLLYKR